LALALALLPAAQALAQATPIEVRKTNGCGCCLAWMEHLEENGFAPTGQDMFAGLLVRFKLDNGVPPRMVSCHMALVDGYVIEGHVPASDIRRSVRTRWVLRCPRCRSGRPAWIKADGAKPTTSSSSETTARRKSSPAMKEIDT